MASGDLTMLFSVRRRRSQQRGPRKTVWFAGASFAVQGGLGALHTTSKKACVLTQALLATVN